jgi:hypothetical protein
MIPDGVEALRTFHCQWPPAIRQALSANGFHSYMVMHTCWRLPRPSVSTLPCRRMVSVHGSAYTDPQCDSTTRTHFIRFNVEHGLP